MEHTENNGNTFKEPLELTEDNYYSLAADQAYFSFHQYMEFCGAFNVYGCEERAMARLRGEWKDETTLPLLVGSFVDSFFDGSLDKWKEEHPECFTAKGELKAPYKQAEKMIDRCQKDELFMQAMSGEKQKIITFYWAGTWWKAKLDSYIPGVAITDLKTTAGMHKAWKIPDYGYVSFVEAYFYTGQLALYQKGIQILTGEKLPCYIAAVSKEDCPEIELINIDQMALDNALNQIEMNMASAIAVKNGEVAPTRCGKCDFCKATKKLTGPISMMDLITEGGF